jgi:glycosyltransferase involved in cell wall biosynthesis
MNIGIDACCWSNRRGFGRFTRELVRRMVIDYPHHRFTLMVDSATAQQSDFPRHWTHVEVKTAVSPTAAASADGARSPSDLWAMARATARLDFDAFFFPAVYTFYPMLHPVPTVVTFHDAIAEQHPGLIFSGRRARWMWNAKTWLARRQADRVLTVSQSARQQIIQAFGYPESRIRVIPEGPGEEFAVSDDPPRRQQVLEQFHLPPDRPLLLYVGGISPHKNLQGLLRALALMRDEQPAAPWHAVLTGDYKGDSFLGCYQDLMAQRAQLHLEDRVSFTGFVSNEDLAILYNAATLLVLPSFSEGFGLPVVEAMACGLPVAVSDAGSLPEVAGDAGVLFDPHSPPAIAKVLLELLTDEPRRRRMRSAGLVRAAHYTWKEAARRTVGLLEELGNGSHRPA